MNVWAVDGVGGCIGSILLGVFASKKWNPSGVDGLLFGSVSFFFKQILAVLFAAIWAFVFTFIVLWIINKITPVHVAPGIEEVGLDSLSGEKVQLIKL